MQGSWCKYLGLGPLLQTLGPAAAVARGGRTPRCAEHCLVAQHCSQVEQLYAIAALNAAAALAALMAYQLLVAVCCPLKMAPALLLLLLLLCPLRLY